jgi:hypothetical protein
MVIATMETEFVVTKIVSKENGFGYESWLSLERIFWIYLR